MPTPPEHFPKGPNLPEQDQETDPISDGGPLHPGDTGDDVAEPLSSRDIDALVAAGALDDVVHDPPVPVTGWKVTSLGQVPALGVPLFTGLTPRLAALLITLYSQAGHLVVDLTADLAVEGAAGAGARRYVRIEPAAAGVLANAHRREAGRPPTDLVLLRWPAEPGAPPDPSSELTHLLRECRALVDRTGRVIVITSDASGRSESTRLLITTATEACLRLQHHHLVLALPTPAREDETLVAVGQQPVPRLDLLVFTPGDGHGW